MTRIERALAGFLFCMLASASGAHAAVNNVTSTCGGLPGAVGDGIADDTSEIQCHINAAAVKGGIVYIPAGTYKVSAILTVSGDKITIEGDGKGSIVRSDVANHIIFSMLSRKDIVIRDLYLLEGSLANDATTISSSTTSAGIGIYGSSDEILVDNVRTRGFTRGLQLTPTAPAVVTNLTLRDVWVEQANGWGIELFGVEKFRFYNVRARRNGSDGIKIGQPSRDWEIHGGRSWDNLQNGINMGSGGHRWLISGTRIDGNTGSGINIKASAGNTTASTPQSEGTIVGTISENNAKGLEFFSGSASDPLPNHVTMLGGVYRNNSLTGIFVDGRNISLIGVVAKGNGQDGIHVRDRSFDVSIVAPEISANGDGSGPWAGIRIDGDRVRVVGAQINGIDEPASLGDPTGTMKQKYSIDIGATASDVLIDGSVLRNAFTAPIGGTLTGATIRDTVGWVTQNNDTATVLAAATEVTVTHGLSITPTGAAISVTPVSGWGNVKSFWVDTVTATTFKIKVTRIGGGAADMSFRWDADVSAP